MPLFKKKEEKKEEKTRIKLDFGRKKKKHPISEKLEAPASAPVLEASGEAKKEAGETSEKKPRFTIGFGKKKEKPVETEAKTEAPTTPRRPVLRISSKRPPKTPVRERGILTREVYRTVSFLVIEGFIFGSLAALLLYVALTGLLDSPIINYIAEYLFLDTSTAFIIFIIPVGALIGFLAGDLASKTQKGIGLVALLSRRGRREPSLPTESRALPIHPGRVGLAGLSLVIPATGLLLIYLFPGESLTIMSGAILLAVGVVISLYLFITALKPPPPLPWYVALVTEVRSIRAEESQRIAQLVRTAGVAASPSLLMARYFAITIILSFMLIPVGVLMGFSIYYGVIALDIAFAVIGLFVLILVFAIYYPYIKFSQLKSERKRLVERDLPFFAIYSSILQSAGLFIDHAFRRLIGNTLFPGISREGRILEKDLRLGKDPLEALTSLALDHPSKKFKDFVFGYTSVVRSGWDPLTYLSMRIREYIQELKFNWRMYAERTGALGELLITLFLMTTALFILIAVVLPYGVEDIMIMFNFLLLPLITIVMIMSIDGLVPQPRIKDTYTTNILLIGGTPLVILIVLSIVLSELQMDMTLTMMITMTAVIVSALLAVGIDFQIQQAEVKGIENALPEFLRDITEYRKIGFPMLRAFFMIKESGRKYNKYFDRLLNVIIAQLRAGVRLNKVRVPTRSWLGRFVFWLLGEIEDTGGGTPAVLEDFTGLITDLLEARNTAKKMLRLYNILTYITPFILIVFVSIGIAINNFTKTIMQSVEESLSEARVGGLTINLPLMFRPADLAIFHAKISVIVASLLLSIAMTKAVDLTLRNTIRVAIVVTMAAILVMISESIAQIFTQMVMSTS